MGFVIALFCFRFTRWLLIFVICGSALYFPVALISGVISRGILLAVLETDTREAVSFITSLPIESIFYVLAILVSLIFVFCMIAPLFKEVRLKGRIFIFFIPLAISSLVTVYLDKKYGYDPVIVSTAVGIKKLYREYKILDISSLKESSWVIGGKNATEYENYIVIIGESVRADALSLYGSPFKTTPFLDKVPKRYIKNYFSPAVNTSLSVPRILALTDEKGRVIEENNAISLARQAGYKTFWISSQGFTGANNRTAARIAKFSENIYFTKTFESDFALYSEIDKALSATGPKVIFIHMTGSHEDPCERLSDYSGPKHNIPKQKMLSCYLTSVSKMDQFVEQVYKKAETKGEAFSLIYTSDHGLSMKEDLTGSLVIYRDEQFRESYIVPFILISSTDQETKEYNIVRDGWHFIDFFAFWIGVTTNYTIDNYNIFEAESTLDPQVIGYHEKKHSVLEKKIDLDLKEYLLRFQ
ncbi:sulfatase-like hydrolase/transferase [Pseudomonas sp. F1_0610]|uniref:phosphoethanolamine transferase n=1 Tax=Pseudomonas sp. F1_0610 TaxID=3114284 RepID=UPI0039C394AE